MLRYRHHVIPVASIEAFERMKGGVDRDGKDVYFVRALGIRGGLTAEIQKMDADMSRFAADGSCFYSRVASLPRMSAVEDVEYYSGCYARWEESGRARAAVKALPWCEEFAAAAGGALADVLTLFRGKQDATASIEKNFGVKLLFWLDAVLCEALNAWDEQKTVKVVMENITKKQEYFFAYFLALLGCDVLLLQTAGDIDEGLRELGLSGAFQIGAYGVLSLPAYDRGSFVATAREHENAAAGVDNSATSCTQGRQGYTQNNAALAQTQERVNDGGQQPIRIQIPPRAGRRPSRAVPGAQPSPGAQPVRAGQIPSGGRSSAAPASPGAQPVRAGQTPSGGRSSASPGAQPPGQTASSSGQRAPQPGRQGGSLLLPPTRQTAGAAVGERRELTYEELAQLAKSVVMIAIRDKKGEVIGTGSGIMVGPKGYILTNNHVASGGYCYSVRIEEEENTYDTDEVIKYNPVLDLAVIRIKRELQPLPVYRGKEPLVRGQKVVAIGSPLGFFNSVSDGIIAGFRTIDMVDMIQFTAPTSPGSSGGAVLNMYGEVIGISTAGMDNAQNINLAMGYECINSFIQGFIS